MNSKSPAKSNVIQLPMFSTPSDVSWEIPQIDERQSTKVDNVIPFPEKPNPVQSRVSLQSLDCTDWQQRVSRIVDLALNRAKAVQCEELESNITTNAAGIGTPDGALIHDADKRSEGTG